MIKPCKEKTGPLPPMCVLNDVDISPRIIELSI